MSFGGPLSGPFFRPFNLRWAYYEVRIVGSTITLRSIWTEVRLRKRLLEDLRPPHHDGMHMGALAVNGNVDWRNQCPDLG